ncbi:chemotaxis protein CheA [Shouchella plakortidis]|uniref:Chemotaxis protein CheA n=2 Tax=Alkalicoccobacillus plakortidis TaxID=444060 RepID=A0ABT0XGT7_9BACI|nr:chemotaxis protein CheA [Alkalicoccobacillus plakortidis]MCM2675126.1 chemotaxis protein CheA [Alkalicoccobacillus plakortidis]
MMNSEYLAVFLDESQEHLQAVNDHLLKLEKQPEDESIIGEIFRSAHTLKGMSATMGYEDLAHLTHNMENVLDLIRNKKKQATSEIIDIMFQSVDSLENMVDDIASGGEGKLDVTSLVRELEAIEKGKNQVASEVSATTEMIDLLEIYDEYERTVLEESLEQGYSVYQIKVVLDEKAMLKAARVFMVFDVLGQAGEVIKSTPAAELLEEEQFDLDFLVTVISKESGEEIKKRILGISEIDDVFVQSMTSFVQAEQNDKNELKPISEPTKEKENEKEKEVQKAPETNKTIRVNIDRLDVLMNLFEELVIDRGRLEQISGELENTELTETVERMSRTTGNLQEIILTMRMMPVETVFNRFPRMIRNLSKDLNKQVHLEIVGAETELDRTIIDEIGDPLVHLLRNSIDHGIETPAEREAVGKPAQGTVLLSAYHSGNHVFIEIKDDGAGISREKVLNKAIKNNIITEEDAQTLTDTQVFALLFEPGFSTADQITDISGRGVGLDVVRNTFESLGGIVTVQSELQKGSTFLIQLPLTLSIIDVMLVETGGEKYAVPLTSIVETAIVNKDELFSAHGQKVIDFRGKVVPLVFLRDVFDTPKIDSGEDFYSLVIIQKGDQTAGLVVDSLIGQHDIVLKSLGNYLTSVFAISGATILGDGEVALIVDPNALIK